MAFLLPVLIATLAVGSPLGQFVTKHSLASVPEGWQFHAAAPADHKLNLHIRLKEENLDQLQQRALDISDPDHADYGKHLSKAEVDAMTAPTQETVDAVTKWLNSQGVDAGNVQSGFMFVTVDAGQAKKLLNADYGVYNEPATGRKTVRTTSYSLPRDVLDAVSMVQPTTLFSDLGFNSRNSAQPVILGGPIQNKIKVANQDASVCEAQGTTTECLRQNYNVHGYTASDKTKLGIMGFLEEVPSLDDLSLYLKKYDPKIPPNQTVEIISINNGPTSGAGGEANLDTQIAVPLTYPLKNVFYSTGGRPPYNPIGNDTENTNEPYLDWLKYTMDLEHPAQTYTISYGDDERTVPSDYMDAVCSQFLKLGARGSSILASSGDSGVGGKSVCKNGTSEIDKFYPAFPASCPWITAVGGTVNYGDDEETEHDGGSGFSNHFVGPDYQRDVVHTYMRRLKGEFKGAYNASGRAYPDVAASYNRYPLFFQGKEYSSGGTSASTPTVASIIALLNDELVSSGKAPLGFLNPWLYKRGNRGFRDITKGHVNACGTVSAFPAGKGWDAATGYGVPNYAKLRGLI